MATLNYTARVHYSLTLELPKEAIELGLRPGEDVEVSIEAAQNRFETESTPQSQTGEKRAKAYRQWADSHSRRAPLLSDGDISRESIYGERG